MVGGVRGGHRRRGWRGCRRVERKKRREGRCAGRT